MSTAYDLVGLLKHVAPVATGVDERLWQELGVMADAIEDGGIPAVADTLRVFIKARLLPVRNPVPVWSRKQGRPLVAWVWRGIINNDLIVAMSVIARASGLMRGKMYRSGFFRMSDAYFWLAVAVVMRPELQVPHWRIGSHWNEVMKELKG